MDDPYYATAYLQLDADQTWNECFTLLVNTPLRLPSQQKERVEEKR